MCICVEQVHSSIPKRPMLGKSEMINSRFLLPQRSRDVFSQEDPPRWSSRKRLDVVEGNFYRQKRRLTGSSSLIGTLNRTLFAFDLCTVTLMRWKSWSFSVTRSRRLLSAHHSASTVKNEVALDPRPPLVPMARSINSNPLCWQNSGEVANFRSSANLHTYPTSSATLLMTVDCSGHIRVTSTAVGASTTGPIDP